MRRADPATPLVGFAAGLAIFAPGLAEARTPAIEGLRLAESQKAIDGDPYQAGRGLLAAGDAMAAIAAFRQALTATPDSIDAMNGLGVAYDRMGRYDLARAFYDAALAQAPDAATVLNNLGYSLFLQGRPRDAIPFLQRAIASDDPAAQATAQRVLNLAVAQIRAAAAAADTRLALAEIAAPRARVELSANGEQRLVLAAAPPAAELAANLGDVAPLVTVARPWTARDDARLALAEVLRLSAEHAAERAAGLADLADLAEPAVPRYAGLSDTGVATQLAARFPAFAPVAQQPPFAAPQPAVAAPANAALPPLDTLLPQAVAVVAPEVGAAPAVGDSGVGALDIAALDATPRPGCCHLGAPRRRRKRRSSPASHRKPTRWRQVSTATISISIALRPGCAALTPCRSARRRP
ncbi:MAG: tetratricopeptide repeat protein [Polymorphobacter sp.]